MLQGVKGGHKRFFKRFQGVIGDYKGLQRVKRGCKGLQTVARG